MSHICSADTKQLNLYRAERGSCKVAAKYFEGGRWYCWYHVPSKITERRRKLGEGTLATKLSRRTLRDARCPVQDATPTPADTGSRR